MELPDYIKLPGYITAAIPFFFLFIGIEVFVAWLQRKKYYRFNDSINDLAAGMLQQVLGIFVGLIMILGYVYIWENWRMSTWTGWAWLDSPRDLTQMTFSAFWIWAVLGFLANDHQYYWFHRLSHEINIIWGSHVAHHSSQEYNLTVALRQGAFQRFFSYPFYLPLAFLGLHPVIYLAVSQINTLYQFWIHTRTFKKFPAPIEWLFNTPSNHRVHHGVNPQYIDKNHAGTFMIWDRMYGTFEPEGEEVVYGITNPLNTWNPLWAQVHYFVEVWRLAVAAPKWRDKFKVWFMEPGWMPEGMGPHKTAPPVDPATFQKYDTTTPVGLNLYALLQYIAATLGLLAMLGTFGAVALPAKVALGFLVVFTLTCLGLIHDGRRITILLEPMRLILVAGGLAWLGTSSNNIALMVGATAGAMSMGLWFLAYRSHFRKGGNRGSDLRDAVSVSLKS